LPTLNGNKEEEKSPRETSRNIIKVNKIFEMQISSIEQCLPKDKIKKLRKIYKVEEEFSREMSPLLQVLKI